MGTLRLYSSKFVQELGPIIPLIKDHIMWDLQLYKINKLQLNYFDHTFNLKT